jgi:hypothetical protein
MCTAVLCPCSSAQYGYYVSTYSLLHLCVQTGVGYRRPTAPAAPAAAAAAAGSAMVSDEIGAGIDEAIRLAAEVLLTNVLHVDSKY